MTEKRWLYFALGVTTVLSVGAVTNQLVVPAGPSLALSDQGITFPDGTVQSTASKGWRDYYLTTRAFTTDGVLTACAPGYHFASIYEVFDPSSLRYVARHDAVSLIADMGEGPPAQSSAFKGWIRDGGYAKESTNLATLNCRAWTSTDSAETGRTVQLAWHNCYLDDCLDIGWSPGSADCNQSRRVWCVEDIGGGCLSCH